MSNDLVKRAREWNFCWPSHDVEMLVPAMADRIEELEAKLAMAVEIIAAAKEMYETAMLTGGGSPEAWVNHVRARNAFASTLAELSSVSCANSKGQGDE